MSESASKVMEVLGASSPFSLKSILVDIEGGYYIDPILPPSLSNLVSGRWSAGGSATRGGSGGDGGDRKSTPKMGATGGPA